MVGSLDNNTVNPMKKIAFVFAAVLFAVAPLGAQSITVDGLVVKVIDEVDVPAMEMGIVESIMVREGDRVQRGKVLGKLDDRQALLNVNLAETDFAIAKKRSSEFHAVAAAEKKLAQQLQLAEQHQLLQDISHRKAANDVKVRAAEKEEEVAKNEYTRGSRARAKFVDSVSKSELDALRLVHERSQLDTKQASFDRSIDLLTAQSEDKAADLFRIRIDQAKIDVKQATSDGDVTALQTNARKHALEIAKLTVDRHQFVAPFDGVVVQRYQQVGQWVKPGDPVVRLIRMNRLRAEGQVPVSVAAKLRAIKEVDLKTEVDRKVIVRQGDVVFVSPEVEPITGKVRVLVEFDNPNEDILPGTQIQLQAE